MTARPSTSDLSILSEMPMIQAISPDLKRDFLANLVMEEFDKHHILFHEGGPARAFHFIVKGWVQLSRTDASGREAAVGLFGPGQSFGEAAMFLGRKYPVDAQVVEPARLARMEADRMLELLNHNTALCFAMLGSMSLHLHQLISRLSEDRLQKADLRLAAYLVALCKEDRPSVRIALPFDKAVLASTLGMAPEALSRSFAALRPMGVEVDGRDIRLSNLEALKALVTSKASEMD